MGILCALSRLGAMMKEQTGQWNSKALVRDSWMDTAQLVCHLHRTHVILPRLSSPLAKAASEVVSTVRNLTEKHTSKSIIYERLPFTEALIIKNLK